MNDKKCNNCNKLFLALFPNCDFCNIKCLVQYAEKQNGYITLNNAMTGKTSNFDQEEYIKQANELENENS